MMVRLTGRLWDDYHPIGQVVEIEVEDPRARYGTIGEGDYVEYVILAEGYKHYDLTFDNWGGVLP